MAGGVRAVGYAVVAALALSGASGVAGSGAGAAELATPPAAVSGYVWASKPTTASYVAETGYEYNSAGHDIVVTRSAVGRYQVRFEHMSASGGVAHATAYGSASGFCTVASWIASAPDLLVNVRCFAAGGASADMRFVAHFTNETPAGTFAYFWSNQSAPAGSYEPSASYRYDSTGVTPVVQRVAIGEYFAYVGAVDSIYPGYDEGRFQVTAYGTAAVHCEQGTVNDELPAPITIRCHDADGDPVDSRFSFSYSLGVSPLGTNAAHATAWIGTNDDDEWVALGWSSPGGEPTVSRSSAGVYLVTFPASASAYGYASASADTNLGEYCHVGAWAAFGPAETVVVRCFDGATHLPTDQWFTLAYLA